MKRIIDGLVYDTSEAQCIDFEPSGGCELYYTHQDLNKFHGISLYRTESGRFFCEQSGQIFPITEQALLDCLRTDSELTSKLSQFFPKA